MNEQITIRDKLIKFACSKLKSINCVSLFNNSQLISDPYGMYIHEFAEKESNTISHKSLNLKGSQNELPGLSLLQPELTNEDVKSTKRKITSLKFRLWITLFGQVKEKALMK
jgi:hypothetical protein